MKKIINVSFSAAGGAGQIAKKLTELQLKLGYESEFLYILENNLKKQFSHHPHITAAAALDNYIVKKKSSQSLFTLFRNFQNFDKNISSANSIINFHWTPGILSLNGIKQLLGVNPVYWTMHDMWALTGGCHFSLGCNNFQKECRLCPQVKKVFRKKVYHNKKLKSKIFYNSSLNIITPSEWLKEECIKSKNFFPNQIFLIRNGVDTNLFKPDKKKTEVDVKKHTNGLIIGVCAVDLKDPRKNIEETIHWIEEWKSCRNFTDRILLLMMGENAEDFKSKNIDILRYQDKKKPHKFYQNLDIFISLSLFENYPTTALEALSTGIPVVLSNKGGSAEIIKGESVGFVVNTKGEFFSALDVLKNNEARDLFSERAREHAKQNFDEVMMARRYIELFKSQIR